MSDGTGLAAVASGAGPTVVLVHGALGDYRQWSAISALLEPRHHVVAISRRYHWPNPPPANDVVYTYESHRDDLLAFLRTCAHPVHLVGHSYGAGVALRAALGGPELIRSLILIEPAFASVVSKAAPGFDVELASRNSAMAAVQALVQAGQDERAAETLIDWLQGGPGGFSKLPDVAKEVLLANASTTGPTFAVAARNVTREQLSRLHVPALVLNGQRTRAWYQLIGEAIACGIAGSEAAVIPDCGHMAIVENPQATAMLMLAFLARH